MYLFLLGFCTSLRLVSGHDDQTVATFTKSDPLAGGTDVEYWSHTDNLLLFYSSDLSAWAVGKYHYYYNYYFYRTCL